MYAVALDPNHRLFTVSMRDCITADDGRLALLEIVGHPGFDAAIPIVVDIRAVTEVAANFQQVFAAVQAVKLAMRRFGPQSIFVVLAEEGSAYGMARMLQQVVEAVARLRMQVVTSEAEASRLLRLTVAEMAAAGFGAAGLV